MTIRAFHPAPHCVRHGDLTRSGDRLAPPRPAAELPSGTALILCIPLGGLAWIGIIAWVLA